MACVCIVPLAAAKASLTAARTHPRRYVGLVMAVLTVGGLQFGDCEGLDWLGSTRPPHRFDQIIEEFLDP